MEAQEASHNTDLSPSPASVPPDSTLPPEPATEETSPPVPGTSDQATSAMTGERQAGEVAKAVHAIQAVEADAKHLLAEAQVAEADVKHLLTEAEEYKGVKTAIEDAATLGEFWLKFLNDWAFNFASGLAYHLLMAMFPIVIAAGATLGFIEGSLSLHAQQDLINFMGGIFPSILGQNVLAPTLVLLRKDAGFLGIIAIVLALYSGSRLFSAMENCFAIIYHTPARSFWRINLMALIMLLVFILLIPVMLLASAIGLRGFLSGLVASLILFQAIYMIVPNQKISLRKSLPGTLVASVALQIYIVLFPLYIRHFLGSYTGNTGFAIILLLFFYYFALILLIGAEVNAFYANGVRAKPLSIAEMVHQATMATDKAELLELARQRARQRAMKR